MSTRKGRDKAVKAKLVELHEVNKAIIEVEKSIKELRAYHEELVNRRFGIKAEIRLLGGKAPVGTEYDERIMLRHLRDERRPSDERP